MKLTTRALFLKALPASVLLTGFSSLLLSGAVSAQDSAPTFYADALPLFQKNCVRYPQLNKKQGQITIAPLLMKTELI